MSTTPGERRALLFLGAIAALGGGVRLLGKDASSAITPHSIEALQRQISASESSSTSSRPKGRRRSASLKQAPDSQSLSYDGRVRPLSDAELAGPAEPLGPPAPASPSPRVINLNTASVAEIERLPGLGPALAERIVRHRTENGRFSKIDDLDAVHGVGPAMLRKLGPLVTF